jgi:hypothetical protein
MIAYGPELHDNTSMDILTIEREARAARARALIDMAGALRRGVVALFTRVTHLRTA